MFDTFKFLCMLAACFVAGQLGLNACCCASQAHQVAHPPIKPMLLSIAKVHLLLVLDLRLGFDGCPYVSLSAVAGKKGLTHMRLDGEPWAQPFPAKGAAEGPLRVPRLLLPSHEAAFAFACISTSCVHIFGTMTFIIVITPHFPQLVAVLNTIELC